MKLRNKDTKKYLLSVAVSTFVAYVVPSIFFCGEVNAGIAWTICVCLLNVTTGLLACKFTKSNDKMSLLIWHCGLSCLVTLLVMGIVLLQITDGIIIFLSVMFLFFLLGIFNLITIGFSMAVYSFIQRKTNDNRKNDN